MKESDERQVTSDKRRDVCQVTGGALSRPVNAHAPRTMHSLLRIPDHELLTPRHPSPITRHSHTAFTLLEVMIASGIFFLATFAILSLVAQTLRNARALERNEANAGMAAALIYDIVKTNRTDTGAGSGDFGHLYPEYSYDYEWHPSDLGPVSSTGPATATPGGQPPSLLEVDVILNRRGSKLPADSLVFLVFNPVAQLQR